MRRLDRERLWELYEGGLNDREIARELGSSADYIARLRKQKGMTRNYRPALSPGEKARAETLLSDGASIRDVAETLGRHKETISAAFPGRGWTRTMIGSHAVLMIRKGHILKLDKRKNNP